MKLPNLTLDPIAELGTVRLLSTLNLAECCRRLSSEIDPPFAFFGTKAVIGSVSNTPPQLEARKRIAYRNGFQTKLTAEFTETAGGTYIACRFSSVSLLAKVVIWFLLAGSIFSFVAVAANVASFALWQGQLARGIWVGIICFLGIPALIFTLVRTGQYFSKGERDFLIGFLCKTLQIDPIVQESSRERG